MSLFQKLLGTVLNTFNIGDKTSSNKLIQAQTGAANPPALRWNIVTSKWEFSNDGVAFTAMGSGGGVNVTAPITTDGGSPPTIGISAATDSVPGSMSAADKTKLDGVISGAPIASIVEYLLATTGATSVLAGTTPLAGNYLVSIYYRVVTAPTTLVITVSWTDATGAQTLTVVPSLSYPVGSYIQALIPITATNGSTVTVSATAGTANQVYVSASILGGVATGAASPWVQNGTVISQVDTSAALQEGTSVATGTLSHAEGEYASATREAQRAHACGRFAAAGDAQVSTLTLRGSTPGSVPNESVELKYGVSANQYLTGEDGKAYNIIIEAVAQSATNRSSYRWMILGYQTGGVATIEVQGVQEKLSSTGAVPWLFSVAAAATPARFAFTFTTGVGITAAVQVVVTVRFTETTHP